MVRFERAAECHQLELTDEPFYVVQNPDGSTWVGFYRRGADYILRFPGLADFEVTEDGRGVRCTPVPGTAKSTVEHLYHNQILPLALNQQGGLVLHGSAVEVEGGGLAFLGASGRGKSTLAASFAVAGHRLLTDDLLELEPSESAISARPGHHSLRLWDDSRAALFGADPVPMAPAVEFTSKARFLSGGRLVFRVAPQPLRCVYLLGDNEAQAPIIEPINGRDVLIELAKNAFLLDIAEPSRISAHFRRLSQVARLPIYYRLDYPRRFDALPAVRKAILDHAARQPEVTSTSLRHDERPAPPI